MKTASATAPPKVHLNLAGKLRAILITLVGLAMAPSLPKLVSCCIARMASGRPHARNSATDWREPLSGNSIYQAESEGAAPDVRIGHCHSYFRSELSRLDKC